MLTTNNSSKKLLTKEKLAEVFFSGCKIDKKVGVESEKILVYKDTFKAITYNDVVSILKCFDSSSYKSVYENDNLIGLSGENANISLEPGSQIEISVKPFKKIEEISKILIQFYSELTQYAAKVNAVVLDIGIQPISTYDRIKVIPKKRYEYMSKYLPLKGSEPFIMMRETAGIQANFDYKSENDAVQKLSIAMKLSPIISAIYSNSPIRNGKLTGFVSNRSVSWLKVDEMRCGYISPKLFQNPINFGFSDYVDILLDIPMIFVKRNNTYFGTTQTFREFMYNGLMGMTATIEDWENHLSLFFPDVRLKSYIEIRNHDAQNALMTLSVPAFWKGIMYNSDAIDEIQKILSRYEYEDFINLRKNSPVLGISAKLGKLKIIELIKEFYDISYSSLKEMKLDEEKYLECVYEYITLKRTPADDCAKNYQNFFRL